MITFLLVLIVLQIFFGLLVVMAHILSRAIKIAMLIFTIAIIVMLII